MPRMTIILIIAVAVLFSGCTVSREARIQNVKSQHPEWDQTTVERVAEGQVEFGMTEEMVLAIMGQPGQAARDGNVWTYMASTTGAWGELISVPAFFVYFNDGRVVEIKGSQKRVVTPLLYSR